MRYAIILILTCVLQVQPKSATANSLLPGPAGWQVHEQGHTRVFTKGKSRLVIGPWKNLNGRTLEVYLKSIENLVPDHVKFVSSRGVKPEGNYGAFTISRNIDMDGKRGTSVLFGCPGQPGYARVIEGSFLNSSLRDILTGGVFGAKACKEEAKGGASESVGAFDNSIPVVVKPRSGLNTNESHFGADIGNISSVWHTGDSDGLGVYWHTYLTFNDGMATYDVDTFMSAGREKSETRNPGKWRPYRIKGDALLLGTSSGGTRQPFFSTRLEPGKNAQTYKGCWTADRSFIPSSTTATRAIFRSETYCFSSNGQYSTDASTVFTTDGMTGSSDRNKNGHYQINGHTITFQASTGESLRAVFGWFQLADDPHPRLVIGRYSYLRE